MAKNQISTPSGLEAQKQPGRLLRVGIAQMRPRVADLQFNLDKLAEFVEQAVAADVDLLVTPELALTGYPVGSWFSSVSITASSPEFAQLKELSQRVPLIVGLIEETEAAIFYNSAVYLSEGHVRHLHRKIYLPTYREFDEQRYFKAGASLKSFDTPWCRMGVLICQDCWHLSLPYLLAHAGADVIVVLAASAVTGLACVVSNQNAWERMNRSYALTLSNFVVFANLVGDCDETHFWGGSHVVLPDSKLLTQASFEEEELLVAALDLNQLRQQRLILPFRRDDSLSLTMELGREILSHKWQRRTGLNGSGISTQLEPMDSLEAPELPPMGVAVPAFDKPKPGRLNRAPSTQEIHDAD